MGKPRVETKGEEGARKPECGKRGCWNQEEEEGHSLHVVEIGSQQETRGGPSQKFEKAESQQGMDRESSLQVAEVGSQDQHPCWHEDDDNVGDGMRRLFDEEKASITIQ